MGRGSTRVQPVTVAAPMLRVISDDEVASVLTLQRAHDAVRAAFLHQAATDTDTGLLHLDHAPGEFHIKAGFGGPDAFACKLNAAWPDATGRRVIKGVVVLFDASSGTPLAILASRTLTRLRTAATTAMAIKALQTGPIEHAVIVGAGTQAAAHVDALAALCDIGQFRVHTRSVDHARDFVAAQRTAHPELEIDLASPAHPLRDAPLVVTCTTSTAPIVASVDVDEHCLIAGVGADSPDKSELAPDLLAAASVVTDVTAQCARVGDLHHALVAGVMTIDDVTGTIGQVLQGTLPPPDHTTGRVVYDATGTGFQDAAVARLVHDALVS